MRQDSRRPDELRPLRLEPDFLEQPHGSVLLAQGKTKVLCTASIQEGVPRWLYGKGRGWLTAEYSLLPASTGDRTEREASRGRQGGRTIEIQRLIGRSLRSVTDFEALGERTLWVDCDVLQADGGTRTAAITGSYVALYLCFRHMKRLGAVNEIPLSDQVAAVSCGIHQKTAVLDLDYAEDSAAEADANFVLTAKGGIIEVQGTAERAPFSEAEFLQLLAYARKGITELTHLQRTVLGLE
jgi:ribonuclease PH